MSSWKTYAVISVVAATAGGLVVYHVQKRLEPPLRLVDISPLVQTRDYGRAQKQLQRYLARNPDDPQARLMLASVILGLGDRDLPLEHLRQIPNTTAWAIEARYREGWLLRQLGRAAEAEAAWAQGLSLDSSINSRFMSPVARTTAVELLTLYMFQKRKRDGTQLVWNWYRRVPEESRARALVALVHLEFSPPPPVNDMMAELERYVENNPDDYHSRRALGRLYVELGTEEHAGRELLRKCVEQAPDDLENVASYVWCLTEQGDVEAAETAIRNLPADADQDGELWYLRGIVAELNRDWNEAARAFRQAVSRQPWSRESQAHLANVLRRQGDLPAAEKHEQRATELFDIEEQLRNADQLMESMQARPDAPSAFTFAELYEKRGRMEEARAWYEETLRLDPAHAEALAGVARLGRSALLE